MKHLSKHHRALRKLDRQRDPDAERADLIATLIADGLTREQAAQAADEAGLLGHDDGADAGADAAE